MSPRAATTLAFLVHGATMGSWAPHIPWLQERFELSNGVLGLVLLVPAGGVIAGTAWAGQAIARVGSRRALAVAGPLAAACLAFPFLAPHPALVALGLGVLGACAGALDVAMNAHGVGVEGDLGRKIMSSLHAGWSFGALAGGAVSAATTAAGLDPRIQLVLVALVLLVALLVANRGYGEGRPGAGEEAPAFALPSRPVLVLAVICFVTMITEGAMTDWSGVYLRTELGAAPALAAAGFGALAAGMTVGRLVGDRLNHAVGPVVLLRGGAILAGVALALALLVAEPWFTLAGVAIVGLGVANGVPLMFSAAGGASGIAPGPAIAAVSATGSLGFLIGPPIIGFTSDVVGLPLALSALCAGALLVAALADAARPRRGARVGVAS